MKLQKTPKERKATNNLCATEERKLLIKVENSISIVIERSPDLKRMILGCIIWYPETSTLIPSACLVSFSIQSDLVMMDKPFPSFSLDHSLGQEFKMKSKVISTKPLLEPQSCFVDDMIRSSSLLPVRWA